MVAVSRAKFLTRPGGCKKTDVRYNLPTRLRAACPRTALDNPFREVLKAVGWTVKLTPMGSSGTGMASVSRERSHGGDWHRAGSARQHGRLGRARPRRGRRLARQPLEPRPRRWRALTMSHNCRRLRLNRRGPGKTTGELKKPESSM